MNPSMMQQQQQQQRLQQAAQQQQQQINRAQKAKQEAQKRAQEQAQQQRQTQILRMNPTLKNSVFIVDNFYDDPDKVRQLALNTPKKADLRYWKGRRSAPLPQEMIGHLKPYFESLLHEKIANLRSHFHVCNVKDPLVYHSDSQKWAGALFLTPDAPPESGTSLWRSKTSKLREAPTHEEARKRGMTLKELVDLTYKNALLDETKWENIDRIGNVYNRLAIWRGRLNHSASKYFGHDDETARLFQLFFFE